MRIICGLTLHSVSMSRHENAWKIQRLKLSINHFFNMCITIRVQEMPSNVITMANNLQCSLTDDLLVFISNQTDYVRL